MQLYRYPVCSIECPFQAQHIPQSLKTERQDHKELYRTSNEEERGIVEELEFKHSITNP